MLKQRGEISVGLIVALVGLVFVGIIILVGFGSYVSAYNYGNSMENQLKAVQEDNKNKLAQYGQKVQEAAQVPTMYAADLQKAITADVGGTFGPNGSSATMQWFKQRNIQLDPQLYRQIQQIIESGRDDFQAGQTRQIDVKRQYETELGSFWHGTWLRFAGYPKVTLKDFDIVSTSRADDAFKSHHEDGPINLKQ